VCFDTNPTAWPAGGITGAFSIVSSSTRFTRRCRKSVCAGRELQDKADQRGQTSAAIRAEELRGQLRRFYVKQVESGDVGDFTRMSDEELRAYVYGDDELPPKGPKGPGQALTSCMLLDIHRCGIVRRYVAPVHNRRNVTPVRPRRFGGRRHMAPVRAHLPTWRSGPSSPEPGSATS
jgi:hypothetical protein